MKSLELLGVIGNPISHSLSPVMHNSAFQAIKKTAVYVPMLVQEDNLSQAIQGAKALGFTGINVTVPFKEKVIPFLTQMTDDARIVGSVNTILFQGQEIIGHTTDGAGFQQAMEMEVGINPVGKSFLVLGAGGAARAIAHQLSKQDCQVYLTNRTLDRAQRLASDLEATAIRKPIVIANQQQELAKAVQECQVIINTTSVGMEATKDQSPFPLDLLTQEHQVIDIIYNPAETLLLKTARELGCTVQNGVGMLVWQAVKAWEFWWGITPPVDVMYQALKNSLASQE